MVPMNHQSVLILGLGKSGREAALLLKKRGAKVQVAEKESSFSAIRKKKELERQDIEVIFAPPRENLLEGKNLMVISPGISLDLPIVRKANCLGIPVISELELASRFLPREKLIAITGTNGKSTTTFLTYRILKKSGVKVKLGGNIGVPLSRLVRSSTPQSFSHIVTEVSSFQLEAADTFSPHIYAILNISPDHLDRHPSLAEYRRIKSSPLSRMRREDVVFLNYDQSLVASLKELTRAKVIFFSQYRKLKDGLFKENDSVVAKLGKKSFRISLKGLNLQKFHSWENVLCAVGIALLQNVDVKIIEETLRTYRSLSHRQEVVAEIEGVKFIDDSKATNEGAVKTLLNSLTSPAVLIMGGKDKGGGFSLLRDLLPGKVKGIVAIGEARGRIKRQLGRIVSVRECQDMREAVRIAFSWSREGDSVVLCPGCSSFDQFKNYRHRGNVFKKEVKKLSHETRGKKLF